MIDEQVYSSRIQVTQRLQRAIAEYVAARNEAIECLGKEDARTLVDMLRDKVLHGDPPTSGRAPRTYHLVLPKGAAEAY